MSAPDPPKTFQEMRAMGFQPKKRKKDLWTPAEVQLLLKSVQQIHNGELIPGVCGTTYIVLLCFLGSKCCILHFPLCIP